MKQLSILLLSLALLAGCSGTRNLTAPQIAVPAALDSAQVDSMTIADLDWWEVYTDTTLRNIITRVLDNNKDLLIAAARIEQLGQLYGVDKLSYLPTITGVVGATRETTDYHGDTSKGSTEISFKGTINWEIDLWGGLSYRRQRSGAQMRASIEDRRALQMTLIAQTATAYFNLLALEAELDMVNRTLITRREGVEKARLRYEGGMTNELVYQQAQVELATTEALVPSLENRIDMARNAITLLMGELPGTEIGELNMSLMSAGPPEIHSSLPSDLLTRRPDLLASEQRLKAAMADCGVAYSDQFPKLRIGITGGWENDEIETLFKSPYSYLLGNIVGTIFDFGRNHRKYKASIAAYDQARLAYEKAVLAAFTEVYNAASTYRSIMQTVDRRTRLRDAAFNYVTLVNRQYLAGSISYLDVMDAYRRYFDAQTTLINAIRDEYFAMINLYKVVGGGF